MVYDGTAGWYTALRKTHGDDTAKFARYHPVAGMNHCSGGGATDRCDMLTALVDWVEDGRVPDRITASLRSANTDLAATGWSSARTRPRAAPANEVRHRPGAWTGDWG